MEDLAALQAALHRETADRRRAQCFAEIQTNAVQLALDLLVREPDIEGFFGAFTKALVEDCESHGCGVWLIDEDQQGCELWMAYLDNRLLTSTSDDWRDLTVLRESMAVHLFEYKDDDPRLPDAVREYNRKLGVPSLAVAPLVLGDRNLGWMGLSTHHE